MRRAIHDALLPGADSCLAKSRGRLPRAPTRPWGPVLRGWLLGSACLLPALCVAQANRIGDWNAQAIAAVQRESTPPPLAARNLAMLHVAIHDAVNAVAGTHHPYAANFKLSDPASAEAAAASAAHRVLRSLFPSQRAAFDATLEASLNDLADDLERRRGIELGQTVAEWILSLRADDGSSTTVPYIPGTEPGAWRRTPPYFRPPDLPHWGFVRPFALTHGSQFRPPGPPPLGSARYAAEWEQVRELGGVASRTRTEEQTLIAFFWADFTYTVTPPGHWNQIARQVAASQGLSLAATARLFALLNIAMADAAIATWDAKYAYNFWRPVTAIPGADLDDNPETVADVGWTPLLVTPAFPEYVSGHSAFSSAAATVLARFLGTDHVSFTAVSDSVPGVTRSYASFAAAAEEIGMSRIYGGIHFLSGDLDGLRLGHAIAEYVHAHRLLPIGEPPRIATSLLPQGLVQVAVEGTAGCPFLLEASSNLADWSPVRTAVLPFVYQEPALGLSRFFRARLQR